MEKQDVFRAAVELIESEHVGVLTTLDERGLPHGRLMGAAVDQPDEPLRLYCLSGRETRKIEHLRRNARVGWLFYSPDHGKVVQLLGEARIHSTAQLGDSIWAKLSDYARPYADTSTRDEAHFSFDVIETRVDEIELLGRDYGLVTPQVVRW